MTEEQKRAIYEWLYEELKGKAWRLVPRSCSACGLPWTEARYTTRAQGRDLDTWMSLTPLDMNTWHGPVEDKLAAEGISVTMLASVRDGKLHHHTWLRRDYFTAWDNADPWLALLQYIEAVRQ